MSRVIIGLSGGVDSAVAALLLQRAGHDVSAVFMKNWDEDDEAGYCPAAQDLEDARAIAGRLEMELQTVSFSAEYWQRVFRHFLDEYAAGRTPSPDIVCNREIKFRAFLDYALAQGADYIATGHYARIDHGNGARLLRAADEDKDQTYFLHTLTREQLSASLFPLGDFTKRQVREMARNEGLAVHDKKDSTGICFIGERRFDEFLARYIDRRPGEIRSLEGKRLGTHNGLVFYTIGQRHGLGIGGRRDSTDAPWYVAGKDLENNVLIVVQGDHPALYSDGLEASQAHWIAGRAPADAFACEARIRHRQPLQPCHVELAAGDRLQVRFSRPQRAVCAGQSVVLYDDDVCLGGAVIEHGVKVAK